MTSQKLILETCLLAGRIMMESGSEVYRVEDTMNRIAANANEPNSISYVTATGIFMALRSSQYTLVENVSERSINLEKVAAVNQLSREFAEKKIDLLTLHNSLVKIDHETPTFPIWLQILSASIMSALLMLLFGGTWPDFIPTFIVGGLGLLIKILIKTWVNVRFFDDLFSSFIIGSCAILLVHFHFAVNADSIIIGAVMALVPGVAITTSFRDILAGHMISGLARGTEALMVAASIGVGIAIALNFFGEVLL